MQGSLAVHNRQVTRTQPRMQALSIVELVDVSGEGPPGSGRAAARQSCHVFAATPNSRAIVVIGSFADSCGAFCAQPVFTPTDQPRT